MNATCLTFFCERQANDKYCCELCRSRAVGERPQEGHSGECEFRNSQGEPVSSRVEMKDEV